VVLLLFAFALPAGLVVTVTITLVELAEALRDSLVDACRRE
jgi:hypothetical protein